MHYYDQHLHTYFSPDSKETFKNYLNHSEGKVVTTEHLDYYNGMLGMRDVIPNYPAYVKKIDQLNESYQGRLLKGIEAGFTYKDRFRTQEFIENKDYDIILLSLHHNGRHGFMRLNHDIKPLKKHLTEYFDLMLEAVKNAPYANVLAHFDFGLRGYDDVYLEDLYPFEDRLVEIFKTIINQDQALELNTRSMYRYDNAHLYEYAIQLYQSLGGKMFTVSSDAHRIEDYQLSFEDAFAMLRKYGVKDLVVYQKQQAHWVPMPE